MTLINEGNNHNKNISIWLFIKSHEQQTAQRNNHKVDALILTSNSTPLCRKSISDVLRPDEHLNW